MGHVGGNWRPPCPPVLERPPVGVLLPEKVGSKCCREGSRSLQAPLTVKTGQHCSQGGAGGRPCRCPRPATPSVGEMTVPGAGLSEWQALTPEPCCSLPPAPVAMGPGDKEDPKVHRQRPGCRQAQGWGTGSGSCLLIPAW